MWDGRNDDCDSGLSGFDLAQCESLRSPLIEGGGMGQRMITQPPHAQVGEYTSLDS